MSSLSFLLRSWVVTIQHHQQGISSRDPGRSGGEGKSKRKRRESTIFNTTNKGLCSMTNVEPPSRYFPQETRSSEKRNRRCQEEGRQLKPDQRIVSFNASRENTGRKE